MNKKPLIITMLVGVVVVGYLVMKASSPHRGTLSRPGDPTSVVTVDDDDAAMDAAIAKARATVDTFMRAIQDPGPSRTTFSVKVPFTRGDRTEHIWLSDCTWTGEHFSGKVNNEPELVTDVRFGQVVTARRGEISDWMYLENGKIVGGYTMRVLRDRMRGDERRQFDARIRFADE